MTPSEKGRIPDIQPGVDKSSGPQNSPMNALSTGVQDHVTGPLTYMDEWWIEMTGEEWKLRIIDILREIEANPSKYKTFKLTIQTGNDFLDEDSSVSMLSASGGVDHAAGAIMGELRKMQYFHPGLKIHIKSIDLME